MNTEKPCRTTAADPSDLDIRTRYFREENMYTRIRTSAQIENLTQTYRAAHFMRDCHANQKRKKSRFSTERVQYINHPLMMACQAFAMGIRDDALLASLLLHDVVEDTDTALEDLPFSDEVKEIVGLVTFTVPEGMTKEEAKAVYFEKISGCGKACMVKLFDRCNNVSTMAGAFSRERMLGYVKETEQYILPLSAIIKNDYPEFTDAAFILKYHIISVIETVKCMLTGE